MTSVVEFLREIAYLTCDTAPFLLAGFLIAGLLKVYVPATAIYAHLGENNLRSVIRASLYGMPLPLCSCSVIPTAASLKRSGASKGATTSFLISTPETGVDSISVTYALLDPIMTVVRPLVALVTAVTTGSLVTLFVRRGWDTEETGDLASCSHDHGDHDHDDAPQVTGGHGERLRAAMRYAFGPLLDDLTVWLVIGFAISALIAMLTPEGFFTDTVPNGWPAMLLMLVIATPVYICATASTPIAAALIAKGLDPGAALVFLLVGPATNATTLLVVARLLGKKTLWVYLGTITMVALLAGVVVSEIYAWFRLDLSTTVASTLETEPGPIAITSGLLFGVAIFLSAGRLGLFRGPRARVAMIVGLLVYASTAFTVVNPGERGWVLRFGGVTRTLAEPGVHAHWPYPIDVPEIVRADEVRSLAVGYDDSEGYQDRSERRRWPLNVPKRQLEDEAEVMTGDGALLRITYSVHYHWDDAYTVRFRIDDPQRLTRVFAEAAIRQVVAHKGSAELLIAERDQIAVASRRALQRELDAIDCGIAIDTINLRDVHAPTKVHFAYRDVASALEDQERNRHEAERDRAQGRAEAQSEAYAAERGAEAERDAAIQRAAGDVARFLGNREAFHQYEVVSRLRMRLEVLEEALRDAACYVLLGDDIRVEKVELSGAGGALEAVTGRSKSQSSSKNRDEK